MCRWKPTVTWKFTQSKVFPRDRKKRFYHLSNQGDNNGNQIEMHRYKNLKINLTRLIVALILKKQKPKKFGQFIFIITFLF